MNDEGGPRLEAALAKMFGARLPALAGPQSFLGPGSPLSPVPSFHEAQRPAFAGPQVLGVMRPGSPLSPGPNVPMRPGAPLSPGLTEKTRY